MNISAADFLPAHPSSLGRLREAAASCRGCELYRNATQTVFGEGRPAAQVMLVGEQPGDQEDRAGSPFVGPAGRILDHALEELEIPRTRVYVTNAVKHFKWTPRGKRRLHKKPTYREVKACRPWLEQEIELVKPEVVVCLGATAAQSLLGPDFRVSLHRGELIHSEIARRPVLATVHPSAILRLREREERHKAFQAFVGDLKPVVRLVNKPLVHR